MREIIIGILIGVACAVATDSIPRALVLLALVTAIHILTNR